MRELYFIFPLFFGLLFLTGRGFVFGLEGTEPTTIYFPQSEIVGWLFIGFSIVWLFPPWAVAKILKLIKRLIKSEYKTRYQEVGK